MRVDSARLEHHARAQQARGEARHLTDLRQPHWEDRARTAALPVRRSHPRRRRPRMSWPHPRMSARTRRPLPDCAAESYAELAVLDAAQSVRQVRRTRRVEPALEPR